MNLPINRMRAVHPGEVLREDFIVPLGLSVGMFIFKKYFERGRQPCAMFASAAMNFGWMFSDSAR